jgi:hypothetical protein
MVVYVTVPLPVASTPSMIDPVTSSVVSFFPTAVKDPENVANDDWVT